MDMLRCLVEEGDADVNAVSASGTTPPLFAVCWKVVNLGDVRFLVSVGARVIGLDNPVFSNSYTKASLHEEAQKLEVDTDAAFFLVFIFIFY
jgi:hypothetical protein